MKREIKFRAWDKEDKWMYYSGIGPGEWSFVPDGLQCRYCGDNIMQYTGVKDKDGKEIYDGDIIECDRVFDGGTNKYVITWNDGSKDAAAFFAYDLHCGYPRVYDNDKYILFNGFGINTRVIGNIHQNPELLINK